MNGSDRKGLHQRPPEGTLIVRQVEREASKDGEW
jgi:hypothetical protein